MATPAIDDGLSGKTWMQLRQCTRIATAALRALSDHPEARGALEAMDRVLTEGSSDPVG